MRLNKKLQYGLLFMLYVDRAGRATTDGAARSLYLSTSFLSQVARKLRQYGLLKSVRGIKGGYEIVGEPSVADVFDALSPVFLIPSDEAYMYATGPSEHRALAQYISNMGFALVPLLRRKINSLNNEIVANELAVLDRAAFTSRGN